MRDAQKKAVYRAEERAMALAVPSNKCASLEDVVAFLERVVNSRWWASASPKLRRSRPVFVVRRFPGRHLGWRAEAGADALRLTTLDRLHDSGKTVMALGVEEWLVARKGWRHARTGGTGTLVHLLRFATTRLSNVLVLHELAHCMAPSGHGREWRRWYLKLVQRWVPEAYPILRASFAERKLHHQPVRKREMSAEQRKMLAERMNRINAERRSSNSRPRGTEPHEWVEACDWGWDGFGQYVLYSCSRCGRERKLRSGTGRLAPAPGHDCPGRRA